MEMSLPTIKRPPCSHLGGGKSQSIGSERSVSGLLGRRGFCPRRTRCPPSSRLSISVSSQSKSRRCISKVLLRPEFEATTPALAAFFAIGVLPRAAALPAKEPVFGVRDGDDFVHGIPEEADWPGLLALLVGGFDGGSEIRAGLGDFPVVECVSLELGLVAQELGLVAAMLLVPLFVAQLRGLLFLGLGLLGLVGLGGGGQVDVLAEGILPCLGERQAVGDLGDYRLSFGLVRDLGDLFDLLLGDGLRLEDLQVVLGE